MITKHAKKRLTQRFSVGRKSAQNSLFNVALQKGYSIHNYRDSCFKSYLMKLDKKQKYTTVKVYEGKVFVHRNKKLITAFNVPAKYGDTDSYLTLGMIEAKLQKSIKRKYCTDRIKLKDVSKYFNVKRGSVYVVALYIKNNISSYGIGSNINLARIDALNNSLGEESRLIVR